MFKLIKSSLALTVIFISLSSFANEDCSSVDFRTNFPLQIRNQKSLAWCFAHSSADNLQFAEKTPIQISAADIAINYGKSSSSKIINLFQRWTNQNSNGEDRPSEYGLAKFASQMIIDQGYCPESSFPSEDWIRVTPDGETSSVEIAVAAKEIYAIAAAIKNHRIDGLQQLPYFYQFKNINAELFYNLLAKTEKNKILDEIRKTACDPDRVPFKSKIGVSMKITLNGMLTKMNKSLTDGHALSVDVYSQIFSNIDNNKNKLTNLHTVMVYGRKYDVIRKQCLYLVKNSYSDDCTGYDPRLHCDKGYLWFPGSVLKKNMTSANFYN
ncbi:MAG: hypothetical protein H7Z71_12245 [Moraxellaceae bacterium]|nr:hypothetical protein [Pseudobdellovibrionaceae bacterium]